MLESTNNHITSKEEKATENPSSFLRNFTHITIPAEIWLRKDISMQSKCLWAELRSLHCKERGGCFASDDYLCEFMNLKRSRLHELFKELKDAGLMQVMSFNGRQTIRRALVPNISYEIEKVDSSCPVFRIPDVRNSGQLSYIDNKVDNKALLSALAVGLENFFLNALKKNNPKHKPPSPNSWAKHFDLMIRVDKRTEQEIKDVIEWALNDPFWKKNILSAEKLRLQFDQLFLRMNDKSPKDVKAEEDSKKSHESHGNSAWLKKILSSCPEMPDKLTVHDNYVTLKTGKAYHPIAFHEQNFKQIITKFLKDSGYLKE